VGAWGRRVLTLSLPKGAVTAASRARGERWPAARVGGKTRHPGWVLQSAGRRSELLPNGRQLRHSAGAAERLG